MNIREMLIVKVADLMMSNMPSAFDSVPTDGGDKFSSLDKKSDLINNTGLGLDAPSEINEYKEI